MLCAMAAVQFLTVRGESQTYDESNQLLSGYTYLASGRFTVALGQPPLVKMLWAVPVAARSPWRYRPGKSVAGRPEVSLP